MKSWVLAAGLLAAAFVPTAGAADLGDDRYGAYGDPRYRAPPPAYNNRDDDDDDDRAPPSRRYSGPAPYGHTCARSEQVRERLGDMGWRDFHAGQRDGKVVTLRARRPNGRLFELTLDRCSGDIVQARPLELRPFGPYALNRPPRDFYDYRYGYRDRWNDDTYAYRDRRPWWSRRY